MVDRLQTLLDSIERRQPSTTEQPLRGGNYGVRAKMSPVDWLNVVGPLIVAVVAVAFFVIGCIIQPQPPVHLRDKDNDPAARARLFLFFSVLFLGVAVIWFVAARRGRKAFRRLSR